MDRLIKKINNLWHRIRLVFSRHWFVSLERDLSYIGIKNISVVFDVGAHMGQTALHFRKVFKQANIHCFEPIPENFIQLKRNSASKDRIKSNQVALGASCGFASMELGDSDQRYAVYPNSENNTVARPKITKVKLYSIDQYLKNEGITFIDLLKIDVEGYEIEVLKGAKSALKSGTIQAILAECDFDPNDAQHTYFNNLWDFLRKENFAFIGLYDVIHYTNKSGIGYCNALFINKISPAQPYRK